MRDVFIGRGLTKIVDLLFPLRCPVCDGIVPAGEGKVCRVCRRKIRYVSEPRCQKCGRQLNDDTKPFCTACAQTQHIFDRGAYTGLNIRSAASMPRFMRRRFTVISKPKF